MERVAVTAILQEHNSASQELPATISSLHVLLECFMQMPGKYLWDISLVFVSYFRTKF